MSRYFGCKASDLLWCVLCFRMLNPCLYVSHSAPTTVCSCDCLLTYALNSGLSNEPTELR